MGNEEYLEILKQGVAAWNKWRAARPYHQPDLSYAHLRYVSLNDANLRKADLIEADLRYASLMGANLSKADLTGVHLNGTSLIGANLREADLSEADLRGANLRRANLRGANLNNVDLSSADLREAILNEAQFAYTILADLDLSSAIGLETTSHHGPSSIGVDTLIRSNGAIPEVFLRGAGLPEIFIQYLPSLLAQPIQFYSCFISYSHADKSFARRLHDTLQGKGIRCWLDEHQMLPGDDIYEQVDRGIRIWDKVLLCCSKDSLTSWWVDNEIDTAFKKEQELFRERGKKVLAVIPLNLDGYMFSGEWVSGKKQAIKSRLAADFTGWEHDNPKFEQEFERVVRALQTGDTGRQIPPAPRL